jgi:hypothetical protein
MNIKSFAVNPTGRLHLRDAGDALMYVPNGDGGPDKTKPMAVNLYGPGSKQHARATTAQSNLFLTKLRKKGNSTEQTTEERLAEQSEFLASCTAGWENVEYEELQGKELSVAIYSDNSIGFIADQVSAYLREWSNFTMPSIKS